MTIAELREVAREAAKQPVPIKIEIDADWLTFVAKYQGRTHRHAISVEAIQQAHYPVAHCVNHIHSLLAKIVGR